MLIVTPEIVGNPISTNEPNVRLLVDASDTDKTLSVQNVRLPHGAAGAQPHRHRISHEFFFVVSGALDLLNNGTIERIVAGESALIPPGAVHAFAAAPDSHADVLITIAPGVSRFEYFRILGRMAEGQASASALHGRQEEFDTYFESSELWSSHRNAVDWA